MPLPLIPLVARGGAFVALSTKRETELVDAESTANVNASVYASSVTEENWRPLIAVELANPKYAGIPLEYAMRWMHFESAGNPCAVGKITTLGPDGSPREMGLGQAYNPDDFKRLGVVPSSVRAYCRPGTQQLSRPLTASEMLAQVRTCLLDLIVLCRSDVRRKMAAAGVTWDEDSADFLAMVKLQHGTPEFVNELGKVVTSLGRAPANWAEFARELPKVDTKYADADVLRVLANATKTSEAIA